MTYYNPVDTGPEELPLQAFKPSFGMSLRGAVQGTFNENASTLAYDAYRQYDANTSPYNTQKLDRQTAEAMVKDAGVKVSVPPESYTQEALDLLISRQQDIMARQAIDARTPWGAGSLVRGSAQLLTGLVDPLNIASAFIPFVGEARAASLLGRAGEGFLARAAVRAEIGAIEGTAGAAVLEPLVYGAHSYLQDDYHMQDSLINLAFGGALGSVLHVGAGAVGDVFRPRVSLADVHAPDAAAKTVAGLEPQIHEAAVRAAVADAVNGRVPDVEPWVLKISDAQRAENFKAWFGESKVVDAEGKPLVVYHGAAEGGIVDANRKWTAFFTDDPASASRYASDTSGMEAVGRSADGAAPHVQPAYLSLKNPLVVDAGGSSYAAIPFEGGYHLSDRLAKLAKERGHDGLIVKNVEDNVEGGYGTGALSNVYAVFDAPGKIKSAIGNSGKFDPNSPSLTDPLDAMRSAADRQAGPDSLAIGSPDASRAADATVAAAKSEARQAIEESVAEADTRLADVRRSLEESGYPPERLAKIDEKLKVFDEAISASKKLGKALTDFVACQVSL